LENLEEIDSLLDTYDHPKLNQEEIDHLNISIPHNEIRAAMKSLPINQSLGPNRFFPEFYQTIREEIIPRLLNFSKK
jgi:hypothetical protein